MTKVRVDVEEVMALKEQLSKINQLEFKNIEWFKDGVACNFDQDVLDDWRFIGLSNSSFIEFMPGFESDACLLNGKS